MPEILIDDLHGWFDPGPIEDSDIEIICTVRNALTPAIEALRLKGLQDAWNCPQRGPDRRKAASERLKERWQSNAIPQPSHSDERRAQTAARMREVWAKRKAAKQPTANP